MWRSSEGALAYCPSFRDSDSVALGRIWLLLLKIQLVLWLEVLLLTGWSGSTCSLQTWSCLVAQLVPHGRPACGSWGVGDPARSQIKSVYTFHQLEWNRTETQHTKVNKCTDNHNFSFDIICATNQENSYVIYPYNYFMFHFRTFFCFFLSSKILYPKLLHFFLSCLITLRIAIFYLRARQDLVYMVTSFFLFSIVTYPFSLFTLLFWMFNDLHHTWLYPTFLLL